MDRAHTATFLTTPQKIHAPSSPAWWRKRRLEKIRRPTAGTTSATWFQGFRLRSTGASRRKRIALHAEDHHIMVLTRDTMPTLASPFHAPSSSFVPQPIIHSTGHTTLPTMHRSASRCCLPSPIPTNRVSHTMVPLQCKFDRPTLIDFLLGHGNIRLLEGRASIHP